MEAEMGAGEGCQLVSDESRQNSETTTRFMTTPMVRCLGGQQELGFRVHVRDRAGRGVPDTRYLANVRLRPRKVLYSAGATIRWWSLYRAKVRRS